MAREVTISCEPLGTEELDGKRESTPGIFDYTAPW